MRVALAAIVLLAGGCAWGGPMSTVVPASDFARSILGVYAIITWATALIGLTVFVALGYILVRYRARPDAPLPAQIRGHTVLELAWTIVPALVLLVIAIPTIQIIFRTQSQAAPPRGLAVQVRGWQWWWEFRYPDLDVVTAFTAVIACINNTGPGLNEVGPATTYQGLNDFATWVCTFAMLVGRLELMSVLVLFTPAFWRK